MYLLRTPPEPDLTIKDKLKVFLVGHWRGTLIFLAPIIFSFVIIPKGGEKTPDYCFCMYTLILMGLFWMSECLPLAITALLPMLIFPLSGIMTTATTAACYVNDTILMFLGSLMLAYSVEQSGLHRRLAYNTIKFVGFSHQKLILGICIVTTFVSMWITNTAATTMMVPIIFAILNVFDKQGIIKMYDTVDGEKYASDITTCYFCCATYSATIGGIGTLIGTGTNLVFKGLFESAYPGAPDLLSFPKFSAFGVPYMILLETSLYFIVLFQYFGFMRPSSETAKKMEITDSAKNATKSTIENEIKKMGKLTSHEVMVLLLFGGGIVSFFCRSPQLFTGWGDALDNFYGRTNTKFIRDSVLASFVLFLMFLLPSSLVFIDNFRAKVHEQLPKGPAPSVLNWKMLNDKMPYSYMFLLGGGFAISTAAKETKMNETISESLSFMKTIPFSVALLVMVISVIFVTNFASNVAVANVFVPIYMTLAEDIKMNPLYACIAAGLSASHCFMLPVGTPGNLIVQGAANIRTMYMVRCGAALTLATIIITWALLYLLAPVVWPELNSVMPDDWKNKPS